MMGLPQARIVRLRGQVYTLPAPPPPAPTRRQSQVREQLREALALAIGMWPLVAVMLLILGFAIGSAYGNAP